jgi:hypothetical protein
VKKLNCLSKTEECFHLGDAQAEHERLVFFSDVETEHSPRSFDGTKIATVNVIFDLIPWLLLGLFRVLALVIVVHMELRVVRSFEHVLVKVHENSNSVDNVYKNVAIKFIN